MVSSTDISSKLRWAVLSDRGRIRERNEDASLVKPWPDGSALLVVLADGMGGHEGGHVASAMIVDEFRKMLEQPLPLTRGDRFEALFRCFYLAGRALKRRASLNSAFRSMGATTIAAVIEPNELLFLYAGDCRLYHFHNEEPPFITLDHTRVAALVGSGRLTAEQARSHPDRSVVTSTIGASLGSQLRVDPCWDDALGGGPAFRTLLCGDRLLFSTDGLHGEVAPQTIETLAANRNLDCETIARSSIEAALATGGRDNATVIVVDVDGHGKYTVPLV